MMVHKAAAGGKDFLCRADIGAGEFSASTSATIFHARRASKTGTESRVLSLGKSGYAILFLAEEACYAPSLAEKKAGRFSSLCTRMDNRQ
ncbi:MAG TPA: hypothetical protein VEC06_17205 [Paucimonas sp.]|nr:hypothetical protein [Paucimonas sp.]